MTLASWFPDPGSSSQRPGLSPVMRLLTLWMVGLGSIGLAPFTEPSVRGEDLRWNQIQVIGSHNSYHVEPSRAVRDLIAAAGEDRTQGLEYSHPPLAEQFSERGIRQVELDVFHDPVGGLYVDPGALRTLRTLGRDPGPGPGPDPDADARLRRPGLKVLHVPDVDFRTTATTLVDALTQIRRWSGAHPRHVPIFILLELKDEGVPGMPTRPHKFDRRALESLEAEIRSVFRPEEIITPASVRGDAPSLARAVRERGWPRLDDVRGKVAFALDNEDSKRDLYLSLHPGLDGQLLFASVPESHPQAAWFKINDSVADFDRIRRLVREGFLVRTRADSDTRQARANDPTQRDRALSSGAQFVSTDYPVPDRRFSAYCVQFPGRIVARSNPVSGARDRDGVDLER
ncbi:MAG: phosphatidylinositol-specific phospholipase C1-like protein [Isosphaeraceae bacterium]